MKPFPLLLVLLFGTAACGPTFYAARVTGKAMTQWGAAWERWRAPDEPEPMPAYVLLASLDRACLVSDSLYEHTEIGQLVTCAWRYNIKDRSTVLYPIN